MVSAVGILILLPVYLIVYILCKWKIGSPVFFEQRRVGKNGKIFVMRKFRSMTNDKDDNGNLLPEEQRMTQFGAFLRNTSLDELPELVSILLGDMSIVGPRPLPDYYLPYYRENELKRHALRGGLIPPDALSGRAFTSWDEELQYDIYYVEHCSFLLDIKIIIMTLRILLLRNKEQYGEVMRPHLSVERSKIAE